MQDTRVMRRLWRNEDGVTMIEYALLAALIAIAMILSIIAIKNALQDSFSNVAAGFGN